MLIISNIALFAIGFFKSPHAHLPPKLHPRMMIETRLDLTPSQKDRYEKLVDEHREVLRPAKQELNNLKLEFYNSLKSTSGVIDPFFYKEKILSAQWNIEMIHYSHLEDLRKLCNEEQLENFDELIDESKNIFGNFQRPPRDDRSSGQE